MSLQELGISERAEHVYREVLRRERAGVAEIAHHLSMSDAEVEEDAAELTRLGLTRRPTDADEAGELEAVPAAAALGSLIERREDDIIVAFRRIATLRSVVGEVAALQPGSSGALGVTGTDELERIEDLGELRERIEELAFFSRHSLYSIQPGGPTSREGLEASRPLDLRGLRRALDMRIIHEPAVLEDEYNELYLRDIAARGAKIRFMGRTLDRMLIMDGSVAVVPIDPANTRRGGLIVRHPGLVKNFVELFERAWEDSADFEPAAVMAGQNISEEDRRILTLLAAGSTDETAARELAISVRHLRRQISRLMVLLDATSRFAAGAAAARRGWI